MSRYCPKCKKATEHRKLKRNGIFIDCVAAAITACGIDLRECRFECNECGHKVYD